MEKVKIKNEGEEKEIVTPNLDDYIMEASKSYIEKGMGIELENSQLSNLLKKMCLEVKSIQGDKISVLVPITRSDVMQQCDIWEDVAIAYGFFFLIFFSFFFFNFLLLEKTD